MLAFTNLMQIKEGSVILDLGGTPEIWASLSTRLSITILNLPGNIERDPGSHHDIRYAEGDACRVIGFDDNVFDIVFSNSVIEHVGPTEKQREFAHEVRRLGKSYWVQTPSKWFPVEAHCGMPFWWFYPDALRKYFLRRWRRGLPAWTRMVEDTRVLTKAQLRELFPGATVFVERAFGIPKSYVAYKRVTSS